MLSSGEGRLVPRRWFARSAMAWMPLLLVIVALTADVFFLPQVLTAWVGLRFEYRLVVSALLLAPLGFVMGMPFPTGLRALSAGPVLDVPMGATGEDNAVEL